MATSLVGVRMDDTTQAWQGIHGYDSRTNVAVPNRNALLWIRFTMITCVTSCSSTNSGFVSMIMNFYVVRMAYWASNLQKYGKESVYV